MLLVVYAVSPRPAVSAELITNGGFETGNFNGWTVTNVVGNIWFNWTVSGPNCGGCVSQWTDGTFPHSGNFDAWNGWAAGNAVPDAYRLRQDITIPNNPNEYVRLVWWDRLQWDLQSFNDVPTGQTYIMSISSKRYNSQIQSGSSRSERP